MLDPAKVDRMIQLLRGVREGGGRLFVLGVGGSAGNAGHAVNDFRKICGMEAYAPTDNVSELTAHVNDDGWESCFVNWLKGSRLRAGDAVLWEIRFPGNGFAGSRWGHGCRIRLR